MIGIVALKERQVRFLQDKPGADRVRRCELNAVGLCGGKEVRKASVACLVGCARPVWAWLSSHSLRTGRSPGSSSAGEGAPGGCSGQRSWGVAANAVPARRRDPAGERDSHTSERPLKWKKSIFKCKKKGERGARWADSKTI